MYDRCEKEGKGQPMTVRLFMGSRKATQAVLRFIAATRAGQRPQRQEQEEEKQKRENDEA